MNKLWESALWLTGIFVFFLSNLAEWFHWSKTAFAFNAASATVFLILLLGYHKGRWRK